MNNKNKYIILLKFFSKCVIVTYNAIHQLKNLNQLVEHIHVVLESDILLNILLAWSTVYTRLSACCTIKMRSVVLWNLPTKFWTSKSWMASMESRFVLSNKTHVISNICFGRRTKHLQCLFYFKITVSESLDRVLFCF